jgi:ribonuclease-3
MKSLEDKLGYRFNNTSLIKKALTHKSYVKNKTDSNERLEFLGDAVLELVVTEYLIHRYQDIDEGKLSKIRAASVNTKTLSSIAKKLELYKHLKVGKSEKKEGIVYNDSILEDAFEAIVGAIYLDSGLDGAKVFVMNNLSSIIENIVKTGMIFDYKTHLQEITQKEFTCLPEYRIIKEDGVEHDKVFYCEVLINEKSFGVGVGKSKKEAEKEAAKLAIEKLGEQYV